MKNLIEAISDFIYNTGICSDNVENEQKLRKFIRGLIREIKEEKMHKKDKKKLEEWYQECGLDFADITATQHFSRLIPVVEEIIRDTVRIAYLECLAVECGEGECARAIRTKFNLQEPQSFNEAKEQKMKKPKSFKEANERNLVYYSYGNGDWKGKDEKGYWHFVRDGVDLLKEKKAIACHSLGNGYWKWEDEDYYWHFVRNGVDLLKEKKAIACISYDNGDWEWQDEDGDWHFVEGGVG